ncbi:MAG: MFS transporter [Casimicrobiaceae bacterium]
MIRPLRILPVITVSQFAGTSLWFAGNAVLPELQREWGLRADALGHVTSAVQLGFVAGTLTFSALAFADRFSPRRMFFACSVLGALVNAALLVMPHELAMLLVLRFVTGFFLAGIYPIGMKIAAGWYERGLGNAIGLLVGALVLGTAFPHLLKAFGQALPWTGVTAAVSLLALVGGALMLGFVPDGPFLKRGARVSPATLPTIFGSARFRASAFGYFGHMWELYPFWAFVPVVLAAHAVARGETGTNLSLWSFVIIAAGSVGCIAGGWFSLTAGSARVAFVQLLASGLCCIASPLMFAAPTPVFLAFLVFWGVVVVGDSPQFSALNAQSAPPALVGSALAVANGIGFSITVVAIQVLTFLQPRMDAAYLFVPLAAGPLFGTLALRRLLRGS